MNKEDIDKIFGDLTKPFNPKANEIMENALFELDVFNMTVISILIYKKIVTLEEFEEFKKQVRPIVKSRSEEVKKQIEESLK